MSTIRVAFYKNSKTFFGRLIRWKQRYLGGLAGRHTQYSHVELVFGNEWWSSSEYDGGVRFKKIKDDKGRWDYIDIKVSDREYEKVYMWCMKQVGNRYNWLGIFFAQGLNTMWFLREGDYFCSDAVTRALQEAHRLCTISSVLVSPARLHSLLEERT